MNKLILTLTTLLFSANLLSAKTITVTNGADAGTGTLREAVSNADNGDVIVFASTVTAVSFAGVINIDKNITINGNETNNTIIQNAEVWTDTENKKRYFEILENAEVTFNHLTLKDNRAGCNGGAIANWGKLILYNCTFSNLRALGGGAIANVGVLIVENCIFENNYAEKSSGGALSLGGVSEIRNSRFSRNYTVNSGGAISNYPNLGDDSSDCVIDNCIFEENKANLSGGAITNGSKINISNSVFYRNEAKSNGIFDNSSLFNTSTGINDNATATLTNCLFTNNTITTTSTFVSNLGIISNSNGTVLTNTGHLTLINCTVADNIGVGVTFLRSTAVLYNTVLWNNVSKFNDQYDVYRDMVNDSNRGVFNAFNSLIGTSNITLSGNNNIIGENPLFVSVGDYSLQENSPAIDKGNNAYLPVETTTDLAGNPRFSNLTVDMGAYEYQQDIETSVVGVENFRPLRAVAGYYDILGKKLPEEPKNGIYIILYDNGKVEKVIK